MNPVRFLPALALLVCAAPLRADEPRWNIVAECQMVVLPQKAALALLPELNDEGKIDGAFARIQEMIAKGEAQLAANLIAKSRDNEMTVATSLEEMRYAAQFDPPHLPSSLPPDQPDILKNWPVVGITPIGFETRNVGASLEIVTKALDGGRVLSINATPTHARFLRWAHYDAGRLPSGEQLGIDQPQFGVAKNTCSIFLRNGQRVLLGVHKIAEAPIETMELFVLKVSAAPAS